LRTVPYGRCKVEQIWPIDEMLGLASVMLKAYALAGAAIPNFGMTQSKFA
jgi:hypothetical protein